MPQNLRKLKYYDGGTVPLFTRFQIESQIESAFAHSVTLPSGGSIVIDHSEALTAIDINSARATKGEDIESTALNTNLEAAEEIARQLRIRDLGGLIVDSTSSTWARTATSAKWRASCARRSDRTAPASRSVGYPDSGCWRCRASACDPRWANPLSRCASAATAAGHVRSVESLALAILRLVGEEARKERTAKIIAQLPLDVANYVLNEKRDWVHAIQGAQ